MTPLRRAGELSSGTLDVCMHGVYACMMCSIEIELHGPQGALLKRSCEADTDGDCLLREVRHRQLQKNALQGSSQIHETCASNPAAAAIVDDAPTLLRRTCEEPHECVESTRLAGGQQVLMKSQEKMDADRLLLPRTCEMTDDVDDSDEDYMDSEEEQELMGCRLPKVCVCVIHIHMYLYAFM